MKPVVNIPFPGPIAILIVCFCFNSNCLALVTKIFPSTSDELIV